MKHIVTKPAWALMLLVAALMGSAHAKSTPVEASDKAVATKTKKKTGHSGQIKFLPNSAETTKERSTRLKRECKGRVNAGACAGYTL